MGFIKDTIKSFKPIDIAIWSSSVIAIILAFILTHSTDYITLTTSLIGATSLIFIAKGNVIGQIICVGFSIFYGVVSYYNRYYGEMITYLCMSLPIEVASIVTWIRNPSKSGHSEVKVNTVRGKEYGLLCLLSVTITAAFFFILRALNTNELIVSTVSVTTSFVAAYLTMRRSEFYGLAYGANDIVLIVLWSISTYKNIQYLPMVICFVIFLVNDVYGFVNWKRAKHLQFEKSQEADTAPTDTTLDETPPADV
ncbi:MAG: nicotinamide mononucleotide transporter [Clostridiales bacterium]|nr:nicotinamide mononucleotide transporter [Clostridiales bacterium]